MDASEEADVDEAPGEECSANIVVPWAMQELSKIRQLTDESRRSCSCSRSYYRRVLDGLDDDAILNFAASLGRNHCISSSFNVLPRRNCVGINTRHRQSCS